MIIKKLSLLIILISSTFSASFAQQKGPQFRGTIVYQIVVETKKGPDGGMPQTMQANFRITCDKDRFGIDSLTMPAPFGDKVQGAKLMLERSGIVTAGMKQGEEYKGVYFNLKTFAEKQMTKMKSEHNTFTEEDMKKRMAKLDSMGLRPVFTSTNESQIISDFQCKKITVKMGAIMMDMWVTDKLTTNLKDYFTSLVSSINGSETDYKKMTEMSMKYYNIPAEMKNATPVRIIIKVEKQAADSKNNNMFASMANAFGGMMINIVNVGSRVDASAFDFSNYKLESADEKFNKVNEPANDQVVEPTKAPASEPAKTSPKTAPKKKAVKN